MRAVGGGLMWTAGLVWSQTPPRSRPGVVLFKASARFARPAFRYSLRPYPTRDVKFESWFSDHVSCLFYSQLKYLSHTNVARCRRRSHSGKSDEGINVALGLGSKECLYRKR